jgi:hypothetical protein
MMQRFPWSLAALAVFGCLLLCALGGFALLGVVGLIHFGEPQALLYWLAALPLVLCLGAWLLLVVWCYVDAQRLGMNAPLWALLVFLLGFPVGPLVYLVLRRTDIHPREP